MILPRSNTWMHLLARDAKFAINGDEAPAWFREPLEARGGDGERTLVTWGRHVDPRGLGTYHGLVAVNHARLCERQLSEAGFGYVRLFAAVPSLRAPRWFIPLDTPAVTSAGFCLYTPFRLSARFKLTAAHVAIRARLPLWYRDKILIVQRSPPPLECAMRQLFPNQPTRLALSSGADGPDTRRKPAIAVLGLRGEQLAFAKLAGSPLARKLLQNEAKVLTALASQFGADAIAPRLLSAAEIDGTYTLAQSPIQGRGVGTELTLAHRRFLQILRVGPIRPAAEAGIIASIRQLAFGLPSPRTDLLAHLEQVMPVLASLAVPVTINHTDFVPWNLRRRANGDIAAFDWDTAELDGLPLYDEIRHLTFVGFCIGQWTAAHAHEQLEAFLASTPLGLRPPQSRALALTYLVHAILRFLVQGHVDEHPMVAWHQELLARLRASGPQTGPDLSRRSGTWNLSAPSTESEEAADVGFGAQ